MSVMHRPDSVAAAQRREHEPLELRQMIVDKDLEIIELRRMLTDLDLTMRGGDNSGQSAN